MLLRDFCHIPPNYKPYGKGPVPFKKVSCPPGRQVVSRAAAVTKSSCLPEGVFHTLHHWAASGGAAGRWSKEGSRAMVS